MRRTCVCDEGGETLEEAMPSLDVFKARLDGTLSSVVWWMMSLPMAGGAGLK